LAIVLRPGFALTEQRRLVCACSYKHLAPLERKPIALLHLELNDFRSSIEPKKSNGKGEPLRLSPFHLPVPKVLRLVAALLPLLFAGSTSRDGLFAGGGTLSVAAFTGSTRGCGFGGRRQPWVVEAEVICSSFGSVLFLPARC